jgi:hypothetical protein
LGTAYYNFKQRGEVAHLSKDTMELDMKLSKERLLKTKQIEQRPNTVKV